ncbi:MAG TPA: fumarate hydratase, partial [Desulfobaccales bacterium]|nr:fumarate hydratase [Desulfobaccales bacterium]
EERIPMCQDCGLAVVFAEVGQEVHLAGGDFEAAVQEGIRQGYGEGYLRKSLCDPLTRAYSAFPNDGKLVDPIFINRIEDRDGRVLVENHPSWHQVITPQTADIMTHLLMGVVQRGTATRVQVLGRPMGGKTGTTNKTRDAWFIGFTPSLITGTWVGMDDERSLGPRETGSQAAAPIFIAYMKQALKGTPVQQFPEVSTVLAKQGSEEGLDASGDDEAASQPGEIFYPENEAGALQERTSRTPQASSQQFFKNDLDQ